MIAVVKKTDWVKVFRIVSMVLFIAYPSVSVKIFRLFRCVEVLWRCVTRGLARAVLMLAQLCVFVCVHFTKFSPQMSPSRAGPSAG